MNIFLHSYIMWILAYGVFLIFLPNTDGACTNLPLTGTWIYNNDVAKPWTFTANSLSGFNLTGKGTPLSSYDCIASNSANVYVLKSKFSYSDRGSDRWLYLCMKITKVSDSLFYFYFLNDLETSVSPQERVYNPAANAVPSDDLPACDYCKYSAPPPDNDIRKLQKQGTSEALPSGISVCLPCSASCDTVECGALPTVDNSINLSTGNKSGDNVTYTCSIGFENSSGNLSRTCQGDGSWSGASPVCAAIVCPAPPAVDHSTNIKSGESPGSTITYTCDNNFERTSGNLTRTCQNDKTWSGSSPVCTAIVCPAPPIVDHSTNTKYGVNPGSTITYTCVNNFEQTSGDLTRTCQNDKTWSGSPPVCSAIVCPTPTDVGHSTYIKSGDNPGATIIYTCSDGFEYRSGDRIRICQNNRNWSGSPPVCYAIPNITNENVAMITAATVAGTVLIIAIVVCCLFVLCGVSRNKKKKKAKSAP